MVTDIGQKCGLIAKRQGKTQAYLADKLAISRITINRFFNGHTAIKCDDFVNLLFELSIDLKSQIDAKLVNNQ